MASRSVADRRGVGRNLRDHPKAWVDWELRDDVTIADLVPGLQTSARYTATGSTDRGNMMLYPNSVITATDAGFSGRGPGSVTATATTTATAPTTPARVAARRFRIEVVDNLEESSGTVRLRSADPTVAPVIDLGFFEDPVDRERLADGIRRAIDLGTTRPLSTLLGERTLPGDEDLATTATLDALARSERHDRPPRVEHLPDRPPGRPRRRRRRERAASTRSMGCGSWTPRSCRTTSVPTSTRPCWPWPR